METKTDILNELRLLSNLLAEMQKVNVFTVPQGYFETISTAVLECLPEKKQLVDFPGDKTSLRVPDGYFDQLATSILNKIKAGETAREEIRDLSPLLSDIQDKQIFEVPAGYFEKLNKVIADKIDMGVTGAKDELKLLSPLLHGLQSKASFEVPEGYFAGLPDKILKKVKGKNAKVVSIGPRSFFFKYGVAAMLTGITALGIYKITENAQPAASTTTNNSVATLDASIEKGKNMNEKQFTETLANLNGADIAKYLENNGDLADVADLRNNLDDINLPSQDDYLLDETTLDSYLKEIEKSTQNN